ncbi:hypothetical protein HanXRQr2_Chr07g0314981 [Helianthus annuus]|uniref:Uncharacterized protein n=1 Tax=Helianthus annuus TaxID=4232 RepID=A0A251UDY8_HELAN|nr:hypothetical protein HanXRQr2_Chr07g0314981 [Helianthus annuus]
MLLNIPPIVHNRRSNSIDAILVNLQIQNIPFLVNPMNRTVPIHPTHKLGINLIPARRPKHPPLPRFRRVNLDRINMITPQMRSNAHYLITTRLYRIENQRHPTRSPSNPIAPVKIRELHDLVNRRIVHIITSIILNILCNITKVLIQTITKHQPIARLQHNHTRMLSRSKRRRARLNRLMIMIKMFDRWCHHHRRWVFWI